MKLRTFIVCSIIFGAGGLCLPASVVDKIFQPSKSDIETRIKNRTKNEFGFDEGLIKQRLKDGIYTETQVKEYINTTTNEEIDAEVENRKITITKLSVERIKYLKLLVSKINVLKPEEVAMIIVKLNQQDLNKFVRILQKAYGFRIEQDKFYDAWKTKDVKTLVKLIQKAREVEFFTAYGNYQNFEDIDFSKKESQFNYRQVLISEMSYDWREKFKPQGNILLTIDYGLDNREIKALLDLIGENKDKIKLIILPWGSPEVNPFDNRNISTYPGVANWCRRMVYSINEVAPNIPIFWTVCATHETLAAWTDAFKGIPFDGINLWNINNSFKSPLSEIYRRFSKYHKNIILSVFECSPDTNWISFEEAKKINLENSHKVKEAGFIGEILMMNEKD